MSGSGLLSDADLMAPVPGPAPAPALLSDADLMAPATGSAPGPTHSSAAPAGMYSDLDLMQPDDRQAPEFGKSLAGLFTGGILRGAAESGTNSAATLSGNAFAEPDNPNAPPPGLLSPGNVGQADAGAIVVTDDEGRATVVPTLVGGKALSPTEATDHFMRTGENLGTFADQDAAVAFTQKMQQAPAAPGDDPLSQSLAQKFGDGGWYDPTWYASHLGRGLGASAPSLALGLAGGAAGAYVGGPVGGVVGGATGFGLGSALPALREAYTSARQAGLDPDAAQTQAYKVAGVSAATGAAMGALGGLPALFEGSVVREGAQLVVKAPLIPAGPTARALTSPMGQAFVSQPAIGAVGQQAQGKVTGQEPTGADYAEGYFTNALTGGLFALGQNRTPGKINLRPELGDQPIPGQASLPGGPGGPGRQGGPTGAPGAPGGPGAPFDGAGQNRQIVGPDARTGPDNDGNPATAANPGSPLLLGVGARQGVSPWGTPGPVAGRGGDRSGGPTAPGGATGEQPGTVPAPGGPNGQRLLGAPGEQLAPAPTQGGSDGGVVAGQGGPAAPTPAQSGPVAAPSAPAGRSVDEEATGPGAAGAAGPVDGARPAEPVAPEGGLRGVGGGDGAPDSPRDGGGGALQPNGRDVAGVPPSPENAAPGGQPVPSSDGPGGGDRAPTAAPSAGGRAGEVRGETVTTHTGRKIDTRFEVLDASALKPATGDLQPRDRQGRKPSEAQIQDISSKLDPALLHSSALANHGSPIIGPDNVLETGNGRTEAIKRAYAANTPGSVAYREMIEARGFDTAGMAQPVLVRRRTTELDHPNRVGFVNEANTDPGMGMSAPEKAKADAEALDDNLLQRYDHTASMGALSASNEKFVRGWISRLPQSEHNLVMNDEGTGLSSDGLRRLQGAMLSRAYGDKGTLKRALESTDDNTKNLTGALIDAAPLWAKLRAGIDAGAIPKTLDISRDLLRGFELISQARERGQAARDIVNQQDAFDPLPPMVEQVIRSTQNSVMSRSMSRPFVADVLRRYADLAQKETTGNTLLGPSASAKPIDILRAADKAARDALDKGAAPEQGVLTPAPREPAPAPAPKAAEPAPVAPGAETTATPPAGDGADWTSGSWSLENGHRILTSDERQFRLVAKRGSVQLVHPDTGEVYVTAKNPNAAVNAVRARLRGWNDQPQEDIGRPAPTETPAKAAEPAPANDPAPAPAPGTVLDTITRANTPNGKGFDAKLEAAFKAGNDVFLVRPDKPPLQLTQAMEKGVVVTRGDMNYAIGAGVLRGATIEIRQASKADKKPAKAPGKKRTPRKAAETPLEQGQEQMADAPPPNYNPDTSMGMPRDPHRQTGPSDRVRQAYHELGIADPDGMVSKPMSLQVHVLSDAVRDKYGFRRMEIERGADLREVADQLADAHQNLQWMAHVMGVPNEAMGLGNRLQLWFGNRDSPQVAIGRGYALGVYRPGTRMILMPGRSNSFAHEWTHALDHYLSDLFTSGPTNAPLLSMSREDWLRAPPNTTPGAFAQLMGSIYGTDSAAALTYMRAEAADATRSTAATRAALATARQAFQRTRFHTLAQAASPNYLATPYELLARSHEAYIAHRVSAARGASGFVAKDETAYLNRADQAMRVSYPDVAERMNIFRAWDAVHERLTLDTLYPQGMRAPRPPMDYGGIGPNHWKAQAGVTPQQAATALRSVTQITNRVSYWARLWHNAGLETDKGSNPGYLSVPERVADVGRAVTFTPRGHMNAILNRVPDAAKAPVQQLIDHLTTDPGSGRHIPQTYEEDVTHRSRAAANVYAQSLQHNGLLEDDSRATALLMHEAMTQREDISALPDRIQSAIRNNRIAFLPMRDQALLRNHLMTSQPSHIPARIRRQASDNRFLLDKAHYDLKNAGYDVGYESGYFPRMLDHHRAYADPAGFEASARQVYAVQFDRLVETDPQMLRDIYGEIRGDLTQAEQDAIDHEMEQRSGPNSPAPTRGDELIRDPNLMGAIQTAFANREGAAWRVAITMPNSTQFTTRGPASSHRKGRVLPPEADSIMRQWYLTDPNEVIPAYLHKVARDVAYASRFGHGAINGIDRLMEQAVRGGARYEDVADLRRFAELITGRLSRGSESRALTRGVEWVSGLGTMALMSRAVLSSLPEPLAVLPRTRSFEATLAGFAHMVKDIIGTGEAYRIAQIAQYAGLVTNSYFESIAADRMGGTYSNSVSLNKVLVRYFRTIGLTALTNMQRRAAMVSHHVFLHSLATDYLSGDQARMTEAAAQMRNLTIGDNEHRAFSEWLRPYQTAPDIRDLEGTRGGQLWLQAATRFTNEVNQAPQASNRVTFSQTNPMGRLAFSLQTFNISYFQNIYEGYLKDSARRTREAPGAVRKTGAAGKAAIFGTVAMAALLAGQGIQTIIRELMFNKTAWDEHKNEDKDLGKWLFDLAFARLGTAGPFDPLVQAIEGLKYQRDLAALGAGSFLGNDLTNIGIMIKGITGNNDTNTGRYNAAKAAFSLMAMPAISWIASSLPTPPGMNAALWRGMMGMTAMGGTSRGAADAFARTIYGPKGLSRYDPDAEPPEDKEDKEDKEDEDDDEDKAKSEKKEGSSMATSIGISLADDLAPLLIRGAAQLPGPVRAVGAALGLAAGAYAIKKDAAQYKADPNAEPKE